MSEHEEQEDVVKVTDRRKFNFDGTVREGVEIKPEEPKESTKSITDEVETKSSPIITTGENPIETAETLNETDLDEDDIPGADDPASFINFLSTLVTNAAAALGAMPHPATGQRTLDLETGKFWIDVLLMLREKTQGNLLPKESQLLEGILGDLQMQYVQIVRATEEKLKKDAAKKFSANDILGKK